MNDEAESVVNTLEMILIWASTTELGLFAHLIYLVVGISLSQIN